MQWTSTSETGTLTRSLERLLADGLVKLRLPQKSGSISSTLNFKFQNTKSVNRYLAHQEKRLTKITWKDPQKFWKLMLVLIQRSVSFRLVFYHKVYNGWYRAITWDHAIKEWHKVSKLCKTLNSQHYIDLTRVYIPKKNGRLRPLGVPNMQWRIVTSMFSWGITKMTRADLMQYNMHGYIPGRGIHTAWIDLLRNIHQPDMFEYDLKSFFNSINIGWYLESLQSHYKLPLALVRFIGKTAFSVPKRVAGKERLIDDPEFRSYIVSGIPNMKVEPTIGNDGKVTFPKKIAYARASMDIFSSFMQTTKRGFPRGLSWSPILSIMSMIPAGLFDRWLGVVYADDGIFWGILKDFPFESPAEWVSKTKDFTFSGLEFSSKPGTNKYIKKSGEWLVDEFTYLGFTFDCKKMTLNGVPYNLITEEKIKHWVSSSPDHRNISTGRKSTVIDKNCHVLKLNSKSIMASLFTLDTKTSIQEDLNSSSYWRLMDERSRLTYWDLRDKSSLCVDLFLRTLRDRKFRYNRVRL